MQSKLWKHIGICAAAAVLPVMSAFGEEAEESWQVCRIGVIVYNVIDNEVQMFRDYYEGYISDSFNVDFVYSPNVSDWADEEAFLTEQIAEGVEGFISFNPTNLPEAVALCEEAQVYYLIGSGNISQEIFEKVEDNEWFLGCIGPDEENDYRAGSDMAEAYASAHENGQGRFLIMTGGAAEGNYMHEMRARGMLEKISEIYGYQYPMELSEIVMAKEPFELETGVDGVTVAICPGYNTADQLRLMLGSFDPDAILSVLAFNSVEEIAAGAETERDHDIWIGIIDCFSAWNQYMFHDKDPLGNSSLNYVSGKYASIIGPSFAAMFQAITGGTQMLRPEGRAFHINQGFWTAADRDEYDLLYGYTRAYAVNPYSSVDLMRVIQMYNQDAGFEDFKELTEAYTIEQALERMGLE